jgi:UDP-N-acetylmuramoyl-tripeptide--D-alanyl-D-alanine ligase
LEKYKGRKNFISYGESHNNDFVLSSVLLEDGRFSFKLNNEKYSICNNVRHNVFNAIPAIIIGKRYGLAHNEIQEGLLKKPDVNLRMQILRNKLRDWMIIADCYNANPQSMRAALDYLQNSPESHKFAILGDMLELGEQSIMLHRAIGKYLKKINLEEVISIGDLSLNFNSNFHYQTAEAFLTKNRNIQFPKSSAILVKGSRNLKLERIVERLSEGSPDKSGSASGMMPSA